jgi:DUF3060 family protein
LEVIAEPGRTSTVTVRRGSVAATCRGGGTIEVNDSDGGMVTVRGHCDAVVIRSDRATVTIEHAERIDIVGGGNVVRYESGSNIQNISVGAPNTVERIH